MSPNNTDQDLADLYQKIFDSMKNLGQNKLTLPKGFCNVVSENNYVYSSILGKYINPATGEVVETKENV